jgi:hypothetical protein
MEHPSDTPVVEPLALPIVIAPVATRLDAPLLAIMFNILGAEIVGRVYRFCAV